MSAQLIDGKALATIIKADIAEQILQIKQQGKATPGLVVVLIGDDPASKVYVGHKERACAAVGIHSQVINLPAETSEEKLLDLIDSLNQDKAVHGILVQMPVPDHINPQLVVDRVSPSKDVDGFHAYNLGRLAQRNPLLHPCTPYGIMRLLDHIHCDVKGQHAVVVGASNIVGRPMALELLLAGATITVCHRFTNDLATHIALADILIVAVGKRDIVQSEWIKPGAIVIDVGMHRLDDGKLCGDIDFATARKKASWITPVPGGVGPMTVAMLLHNTLLASLQDKLT